MNGLLVLDKPAGLTSHDVVAVVRRVTGERSIGHLGTLDPMATGVLPLLLGRYTRLAQFFRAADKVYTGAIRFGFATDTYDAEGEPTSAAMPLTQTLQELRALGTRFQGQLEQVPPVYSAKKINGVPAHQLARQGKDVRLKAARVTVHEFTLDTLEDTTASFRLRISSGGYVRSVAHELGALAGCGAHLASLCRIAAGPFLLAEAVTLEQLKATPVEKIPALLPHPRTLLPEMPSVTVDERVAGQLRNGMQGNLPEFGTAPLVKIFTSPRDLLGIGRRVAGALMQPIVILG